jgi:hypothetical protein
MHYSIDCLLQLFLGERPIFELGKNIQKLRYCKKVQNLPLTWHFKVFFPVMIMSLLLRNKSEQLNFFLEVKTV